MCALCLEGLERYAMCATGAKVLLSMMFYIPFCILEVVEGELSFLEVLEMPEALEVTEVMRCVLLCWRMCRGELSFGVSTFPLWQLSRHN